MFQLFSARAYLTYLRVFNPSTDPKNQNFNSVIEKIMVSILLLLFFCVCEHFFILKTMDNNNNDNN